MINAKDKLGFVMRQFIVKFLRGCVKMSFLSRQAKDLVCGSDKRRDASLRSA
jgi:hypothetical protein